MILFFISCSEVENKIYTDWEGLVTRPSQSVYSLCEHRNKAKIDILIQLGLPSKEVTNLLKI